MGNASSDGGCDTGDDVPHLETERLVLTLPGPDNVAVLLDYVRRNHEHHRPWSPPAPSDAFTEGATRRLIQQGSVRIDGEPLDPATLELDPADLAGHVLQVGKRKFLRIDA